MTYTLPCRVTSTAVTVTRGTPSGVAPKSGTGRNGLGRSFSGLTVVVWEQIATDVAARRVRANRLIGGIPPPCLVRLQFHFGLSQVFRSAQVTPIIVVC